MYFVKEIIHLYFKVCLPLLIFLFSLLLNKDRICTRMQSSNGCPKLVELIICFKIFSNEKNIYILYCIIYYYKEQRRRRKSQRGQQLSQNSFFFSILVPWFRCHRQAFPALVHLLVVQASRNRFTSPKFMRAIMENFAQICLTENVYIYAV